MVTRERNIVQIAVSGDRLFALASDGSLWKRYEEQWLKIKGLPDKMVPEMPRPTPLPTSGKTIKWLP